MKNLCFLLLFLCYTTIIKTQNAIQIDTSNKTQQINLKRYLSILPHIGGVWYLDTNSNTIKRRSLVLGLSVGQGININRFNVGFYISQDVVFVRNLNNHYRSYFRLYGEYQFYRYADKINLHIGFKPYALRYEYTPDGVNFHFLNDPIDGKKKIHYIGGAAVYLGVDVRLGQRCHLLLGIGYDKKFSNKSGGIPDDVPMLFNMDIRTPFPKFLMKKNSKVQNYY